MSAQLPDPNAAQNLLYSQVHLQVFLQKCAAAGLVPQTDEQVFQMVETAGMLRELREQETVKSANSHGDFFSNLYNNVANVAAQRGLFEQAGSVSQHAATNLAAELMKSPDLYNAVLSVKQAEAQHIAAQMQR